MVAGCATSHAELQRARSIECEGTELSLSAVIVHYRGGAPFRRCVESCLAASAIDEVVIVDNGGLDRSTLPDGRVRVQAMGANVGYGAAANAGFAAATGDHLLLLNQDTEITDEALAALLSAGTAAGASVVGPRVVDGRGVPSALKQRFPSPLRWTPPEATDGPWQWVPWIGGAVMLVRSNSTDLRFDKRLFMYAEDEELCWRVWERGGTVIVADDALVLHIGGTTTRTRWSRRAITMRTIVNRGRFVVWHAGWAALPAYVWSIASRRASRRAQAS